MPSHAAVREGFGVLSTMVLVVVGVGEGLREPRRVSSGVRSLDTVAESLRLICIRGGTSGVNGGESGSSIGRWL
jgi:hypothetical protein